MWSASLQDLNSQTSRITISGDQWGLTFEETFRLMSESDEFRSFFTKTLRGSPFDAFFWELPPITSSALAKPFECVLVEGAVLRRLSPDPRPFAEHFRRLPSGQSVVAFPNLGGDAQLIVPAPLADSDMCYTHLAAFLRGADHSQVSALWKLAGDTALASASDTPFWLSTAGLGVSWLHLRLDSRPKYYRYQLYKAAP